MNQDRSAEVRFAPDDQQSPDLANFCPDQCDVMAVRVGGTFVVMAVGVLRVVLEAVGLCGVREVVVPSE